MFKVPDTEASVYEALLGAGKALTVKEAILTMFPEGTPKELLKWLETGVREDIHNLIKDGWVRCVSRGVDPKYEIVKNR